MEPQRDYSGRDGIQPNIRPKLGVIQGGGETSEPSRGHLNAIPGEGSEPVSPDRLRALEGGGETTERPRGHLSTVGGSSLAARENNASDGVNYTGDDGTESEDGDNKPKRKGWWTRKKVAVAGSVAGAGVTGGLLGLSFVAGPLQLLQFGGILHDAHYTQQEDAGDNRMGRLFRYFRSKDPGDTRLTYISYKYKNNILGDLKEAGITVGTTDNFGYYKNLRIDTSAEKSPYKGLSNEEAIAAIKEQYGDSVKVSKYADGKFVVQDVKSTWRTPKSTLKAAIRSTGKGAIATSARAEILKKYYGITRHPLAKLAGKADEKIAAKLKAYKDKWTKRIKSGTEPAKVTATGAKDSETTDKNGKTTSTSASPGEQATAESSPKEAGSLSKLKVGGSIAGGAAAAAGIACALEGLDEHIAGIAYAQVIIPMIRVGAEAVSVGEQIKSGQDVDPAELQYLTSFMSSHEQVVQNGVKKDVTTTATNAKSIRANNGLSGGTDLSQGLKDSVKEKQPSWLGWTQNSLIKDDLCSDVGQGITTIVGTVIGVIGGPVSFITSSIISYMVVGHVLDDAANLLAGDALDVAKLSGAQYGEVADYGATLAANAAAVSEGATAEVGSVLSDANVQVAQEQKSQFDSENFFARTFDLSNYKSLAATVLAGQSNSFMRNAADSLTGLASTFSDALKLPFNLYGSTAHAAVTPYQYPFPVYGFSQQDLSNSDVADPYTNADTVSQMLSGPNGGAIISKAKQCFDVDIKQTSTDDGSQVWDVIPGSDPNALNLYDTNNYHPDDCSGLTKVATTSTKTGGVTLAGKITTDSKYKVVVKTAGATTTYNEDPSWLKVRMFILDTSSVEGYACAEFNDATSCQNDGVTSPDTTASQTPAQIPVTTGTATSPTIVLDPGHSPATNGKTGETGHTDPTSGLNDADYENEPEMQDMWDVSQLVKQKLTTDGYNVLVTKSSAKEKIYQAERSNIANKANAALALSIHDNAGPGGCSFSSTSQAIVYDQSVGTYRTNPGGGNKVTFTDQSVAATSQKYGAIFQKDRSSTEGKTFKLQDNVGYDLGSRQGGGFDPGNIWLVQLLSKVPWIYNENCGNSGNGTKGLNQADKQKYADGLIQSVEDSVPIAANAPAAANGLPVNQSTGNATQVITVKAASKTSTTASLQAWDNINGAWQKHGTAIAANVGVNGLTDHPSESLSATPIGSFTLTQAFGNKANPGTNLKYTKTNNKDWWNENPKSKTYNQLVVQANSPGGNSEHLFNDSPYYNYAVVIDANTTNAPGGVVPGAGSGFFLHVSENKPTAGCVSIPEANLKTIMQWLKTSDNPRILIDAGA